MERKLYKNVRSYRISWDPEICLKRPEERSVRAYQKSFFPERGYVGKPTGRDKAVQSILYRYAKDPMMVEEVVKHAKAERFDGPYQQAGTHEANISRFEGEHAKNRAWMKTFKRAKERLIKRTKPANPLKVKHWSTDAELKDDVQKWDTHAGFPYFITGRRKKEEYLDGVLSQLLSAERFALENGIYDIPCIIGPRYQWRGLYDEQGRTCPVKIKNRTIVIYPLYSILTECRFSKGAQWWMGQLDVYAGGKKPDRLWQIVNKWRKSYQFWLSLDYSHYDQSIPGWLIREAFDIVKSWFGVLSDEEEALWQVVVNTFVCKGIVGPNGDMVHTNDGVPSGSMFTSIIDSLVNMLMIQTYYYAKGHDEDACFNICGDDNLLFHNGWIDIVDLSSYLSHNFGIETSPTKCGHGSHIDDPEYLSRFFTNKGIYRHPLVLIAHMLFPEHYRDYKSNPQLRPELILYAYYLAYPVGMSEAFDMNTFFHDFSTLAIGEDSEVWKALPGFLSFMVRYEGLRLSLSRP